MADPDDKAPGELRSNLQIGVRIFLLIVILIVLIGFALALFRRPERVVTPESKLLPFETTHLG